jgi:hypothetical protein
VVPELGEEPIERVDEAGADGVPPEPPAEVVVDGVEVVGQGGRGT